MSILRTTLLSALFVLLVGLAVDSQARSILADESHDQQWPLVTEPRFSEIRALLTGEGHSLSSLQGEPGAVTAGALAGFDVFYTGTLNTSYQSGEVTALQDYVAGGGGVICCHDGGWASNDAVASVNSFLAPYGIVMSGVTSYGSGVIVSDFADHCLLEAVASTGFDFLREMTQINPPAVDLTISGIDIIAYYDDPSGGWVIVIGDDNQWTNSDSPADYTIADLDNQALSLNIFNYNSCNSPTEASSWSRVKSLY